jgi:hypothetical protein
MDKNGLFKGTSKEYGEFTNIKPQKKHKKIKHFSY